MIIDIPVLENLSNLQTQHGLNYENFRSYRSFCSRRLHRLRRSLNVHQGIASSARARHQRGRKLMDVTNAMVTEAGSKNDEYGERMLVIPLFLAERAWSFAMELKQEIADHPRRKYHLLRRIKKASDYAQKFKQLCHDEESPCSERTKLESTAYAAYMDGVNKVEHQKWSEAKVQLKEALVIYFRLCLLIEKDDILEHYRRRVDELRSSLRYCAFNLEEMAAKKNHKVQLPTTLQFHDIAFRHLEKLEREQLIENAENTVPDEEIEDDDEYAEANVDQEFAEARTSENEDDEGGEEEEKREPEGEQGATGGALSYFKRFLRG